MRTGFWDRSPNTRVGFAEVWVAYGFMRGKLDECVFYCQVIFIEAESTQCLDKDSFIMDTIDAYSDSSA